MISLSMFVASPLGMMSIAILSRLFVTRLSLTRRFSPFRLAACHYLHLKIPAFCRARPARALLYAMSALMMPRCCRREVSAVDAMPDVRGACSRLSMMMPTP